MIEPQWTPTEEDVEGARITEFTSWAQGRYGVTLPDYQALWRWSVDALDDFWHAVWEYFEVQSSTPVGAALTDDTMPGARWFPGVRLNYKNRLKGDLHSTWKDIWWGLPAPSSSPLCVIRPLRMMLPLRH